MWKRFRFSLLLVGALATLPAVALDGRLRVATWNISSYTGSNASHIKNVVYGEFQGRSMTPDAILAQEIQSASAATAFLSALNTATNSPGDWAASYATLTGTNSTNSQATFYRTSKVQLESSPVLVRAAQGVSGTPRDVHRWDFKIVTSASLDRISLYNVHLKAGTEGTDELRRQDATQAIRTDAQALGTGRHFLLGGDLNIQRATADSYELLTKTGSGFGPFYDPIKSPGAWTSNSNFKFLHTQDPSGGGGMDDRFDQLLISGNLRDGVGLDYDGDWNTAFSTTTWNDPNHSYRTWGNDGTSYNSALTTTGNAMVGSSIAQSIKTLAGAGGGHIPVYMDLKYTPVPEPSTLVVLGLAGLLARRRRPRKSSTDLG